MGPVSAPAGTAPRAQLVRGPPSLHGRLRRLPHGWATQSAAAQPRAGRRARAAAKYDDAYCLVDSDGIAVGGDAVHVNDLPFGGDASGEVPEIAGEQVAAIVFTSGTTGHSTAHPKTWRSLVTGAQTLGAQLKIRPGAGVLGTVPAQHMFGLETTVLLPLQWGLSVHPGRPLLPGDMVAVRKEFDGESWLMTTPLHLRACLAADVHLPRLEGVISSTMPLAPELARAAEERWQTPVHEIYGCTETGMVALRRTASEVSWRLCHGLRLRQAEDGVWVKGGHVTEPVRLLDRIVMHDTQHFTLQGRSADMVKVGGKRISLDTLNAELTRIPGVLDGAFLMPDSAHSGGTDRLTAFAVAPGLTEAAIVAALRRRIDPAFLPRPLYLVAQLPRSATGKLPRAALHELATSLARADERARRFLP